MMLLFVFIIILKYACIIFCQNNNSQGNCMEFIVFGPTNQQNAYLYMKTFTESMKVYSKYLTSYFHLSCHKGDINTKNEFNKTQNMFVDPNPNAFHMFENFNLNQKVFASEQRLVKLLKKLKVRLKSYHQILNALGTEKKSHGMRLDKNQNHLYPKYSDVIGKLDVKEYILNNLSTFPKKYDYDGSVKGMVILQNTYNFDLQKATSNKKEFIKGLHGSELLYYDFPNSKSVSFPAREHLDFEDLVVFAHKAAYYYHFYDTSIQFLVETSYLQRTNIPSQNLYDYFLNAKSSILKTHNDKLLDGRKRLGTEFRGLPYIVNDNLQPIDPNIEFEGNFKFISLDLPKFHRLYN